MNLMSNRKGFTLIEMVIVIVIIAILATILVPSLLEYVNNAREKKLMTTADTINKAILTEVATLAVDGKDFNTDSTNSVFDDEFWGALGHKINATVVEMSSGEDADYLVEFEIVNNIIFTISVSDGDTTISFIEGAWKVVE